MAAAKWSFKTLPLELRDISVWPAVDVSLFTEPDRVRIESLITAVTAYLKTGKINAISEETGVAKAEIIRYLNRCVSPAMDGRIEGWRALVKGHRTSLYQRDTSLPKGYSGTSKGFAGAFLFFLSRNPDVKEFLDSRILKKKKKGLVHEACVSIESLHSGFVEMCESKGLTSQDYPLNTKSCGKRSLARYVNALILENLEEATTARYGAVARSMLETGTGHPAHLNAFAPYDQVGTDAHKIDCVGSIRIVGPAGPQRIAVERLWYIPTYEFSTRSVLGFSIGIRVECSSATIGESLESALSVWVPRKPIVDGMEYKEGAGLPSGLIPELAGVGWGIHSFDNAAAHFSAHIAERARRRIGCAVTYGSLGHWESRSILERLFKTLESYGFQRLPSSTGASSSDPKRPANPNRQAIELGIDWEVLLDLADILTANYNVKRNEGLGNQSPIEALKNHLYSPAPTFLPRPLPPASYSQPELGIVVEIKNVNGNLKLGRRPYIQIDRVKYSSISMASAMHLIGKNLVVHIHEKNMQTVRAFEESSGAEIGILQAQGGWRLTPHTREMRKQVNSLVDAGYMKLDAGKDPIASLMEFLASESHKDAEKNAFKTSSHATKLANAANVSKLPIPEVTAPQKSQNDLLVPEELDSPIYSSKPVWKTIT